MPKKALTQLFVDRITPPKSGRIEYWDTAQPGLHLRLSSAGTAAWAVMYRVGGRQVRETLGTLREIPKVIEARRLAAVSIEAVGKGINPVRERRDATVFAAANTVGAAVKRYLDWLERDLKRRPATLRGYRQLFDHDVLPAWRDRPVSSITDGDVLVLLNKKRTRRERQRRGRIRGATGAPDLVLPLVRREGAEADRARRRPGRRDQQAGRGTTARPRARRRRDTVLLEGDRRPRREAPGRARLRRDIPPAAADGAAQGRGSAGCGGASCTTSRRRSPGRSRRSGRRTASSTSFISATSPSRCSRRSRASHRREGDDAVVGRSRGARRQGRGMARGDGAEWPIWRRGEFPQRLDAGAREAGRRWAHRV